MNTVEDRLRDAVQAAARTVMPDALQELEMRITGHADTTALIRRRERPRGRIVLPLAAAAAVAAVAVLVAVLPRPEAPRQRVSSGPASVATPRFLVGTYGSDRIFVFSRTAGRLVATFRTPLLPGSSQRATVASIAASNGRTFLVDLDNGPRLWAGTASGRILKCKSWLYQLTLSPSGQPGPLTPFAALPELGRADTFQLAVSGNAEQIAYIIAPCMSHTRRRSLSLATTSAVTGQTRLWIDIDLGSPALSPDGRLLLYNLSPRGSSPSGPQEIRVIPVSAPPEEFGKHSRTVVSAAVFGHGASVSIVGVSPDDKTAYFLVMPQRKTTAYEVGSISLAGGRPRIIASGLQYPGDMVADPRLRHMLVWQGSLRHRRLVMLNLRTGRTTVLAAGFDRFVNRYGFFAAW